MKHFFLSRLFQSLIVLFGVSIFAFAFLFLAGDPMAAMVQPDWTQQHVEELRVSLGFDRPWYIQYVDFLGQALRGNFGNSLRHHQPVFTLILERIPATVELAGVAFALSVVVGVPIGVISATRQNSVLDHGSMFAALLSQAMPTFWLGMLLILLFGVELRWFPVSGRGSFLHLVLPAITLATYSMARNARLVRSSLLDVLTQDFVRTARAKGLAERAVIYRHGLRNALVPVVTVMGLDLGSLLSGAVITETVFAWPGVGRLIVAAVAGRDLPLVQAAVLLVGVLFVFINILVDLSYALLDPRVRDT